MTETFDPRVTPWQIDDSEFYELDSFADRMEFLLRFAVLAPSTRNTQPWAFRITSDSVEVFADSTRQLSVIDPDAREMLMSIGAAITNFRVASAHFGCKTTVHYELPSERSPVATIAIEETCAPDEGLGSLFGAIRKRHTNRGMFDNQPIEPESLSRVLDVFDLFPDTLQLVIAQENIRAAQLIEYGDRLQMNSRAMRREIAAWLRPNGGPHEDGVPAKAFGIPALFATVGSSLIRWVNAGFWIGRGNQRLVESASALLVVTAEDDQVSLLRAGEVLERLLLTVTAVGLQYSFLNSPVEVGALRESVRMFSRSRLPAQLMVRIGNAPPVGDAVPRRPIGSVVLRSA